MTSIREQDEEVSSFVYLVNESQLEKDAESHKVPLESWGNIFGKPKPSAVPGLEPPKLLVASSLLRSHPLDISDLCSLWKENISREEVLRLMPHNKAEDSVREAISNDPPSQMAVQLREELLKPMLLRKTTVGKYYVTMLKKRRKEIQGPGGRFRRLFRRRQVRNDALETLKTELKHWKKCKLPGVCTNCRFTQSHSHR